uniref:GST N-terminal domain-containing protein n=1 Tax=Monodelphis domestica TaxID=13616 RepID=F6RC85_MONDO
MSLELYLDLISPPCRSIYVFAKMNNIRFDYFPVDLLRGDHHSKEFEAINMLKTVPVLKEGDFTLIERQWVPAIISSWANPSSMHGARG